jgi:Tol biopolymer transport system component
VEALDRQPTQKSISQRWVDREWGIYLTEGAVTRKLAAIDAVFPETPELSWDETLIAYLSENELGRAEIYVMNIDGSERRQITGDGLAKTDISWRP